MTAISATSKVRVGVGVFILQSADKDLEDPRFLIGKRLNAHGAGTWALPGGHLEFGETLEECAAREVEEETGLRAEHLRFLTATNDYMPQEDKHYVTMFMVCDRSDGDARPQIMEAEKCEVWEWASWKDVLRWVGQSVDTRADERQERKLFLPLLNLVRQRPGVKPTIAVDQERPK